MNLHKNPAIIITLLAQFLVFSCIQPSSPPEDKSGKQEKKQVEKINKVLVQKEDEVIQNFIERRGWHMKETGSGLRYMIIKEGNGQPVQAGKDVTISYRLSLLDGTLCYSSGEQGLKTFRVGQGGVEQGLEEGILLLHVGDEARFILPSHLAHGLLGDGNRIPARATVLYEVEVIQTSNN
jgi:FKBP-type peptidyl-prolyl cis-trans isomerase FkpA